MEQKPSAIDKVFSAESWLADSEVLRVDESGHGLNFIRFKDGSVAVRDDHDNPINTPLNGYDVVQELKYAGLVDDVPVWAYKACNHATRNTSEQGYFNVYGEEIYELQNLKKEDGQRFLQTVDSSFYMSQFKPDVGPVQPCRGCPQRPDGTPITGVNFLLLQQLMAAKMEKPSKILLSNGEPLVLWHGSNRDFDAFDLSHAGENVGGGSWKDHRTGESIADDSEKAVFLSSDKAQAVSYAMLAKYHEFRHRLSQARSLHSIVMSGSNFDGFHSREELLEVLLAFSKDVPQLRPVYDAAVAEPQRKIISDIIPSLLGEPEKRVKRILAQEQLSELIRKLSESARAMQNGGLSNQYNNTVRQIHAVESLKRDLGRLRRNDATVRNVSGTFEQYDYSVFGGSGNPEIYLSFERENRGDRERARCVIVGGESFYMDEADDGQIARLEAALDRCVKASVERYNSEVQALGYNDGVVLYRTFVRLENPLEHDYEGSSFPNLYKKTDFPTGYVAARQVRKALEDGNDGVIYRNIRDPFLSDSYGVFDPSRITIAGKERSLLVDLEEQRRLWADIHDTPADYLIVAAGEADRRTGKESLTDAERLCMNVIEEGIRKAGLNLVYATEEEKEAEMRHLQGKDFLWFSDNSVEFSKTVQISKENHGIVSAGLSSTRFQIVSLDRHPFEGVKAKLLKDALEWLQNRNNIADAFPVCEGSPRQYTCHLGSNVRRKMLSQKAVKKSVNPGLHVAVVLSLKKILDNSIDCEIHPDYRKDEINGRNVESASNANILIHRMYCAVEFDSQLYLVKTTLKEYVDGYRRPYTFEIQETEIVSWRQEKERLLSHSPSGSDLESNSVYGAKLLKNISKSYEPGKNLLEESDSVSENMSRLFMHLRTPAFSGTGHKIYGWARGNTVYITRDGLVPGTPIHEYTHLWARAMMRANPDGWKRIVSYLKESPLWKTVEGSAMYASLTGGREDKIAGEVLSRLTADSVYSRLEVIANASTDDASMKSGVQAESRSLESFWKWTGDSLFPDLRIGSMSELKDRVFYDLVNGTRISRFLDDETDYKIGNSQKNKIPARRGQDSLRHGDKSQKTSARKPGYGSHNNAYNSQATQPDKNNSSRDYASVDAKVTIISDITNTLSNREEYLRQITDYSIVEDNEKQTISINDMAQNQTLGTVSVVNVKAYGGQKGFVQASPSNVYIGRVAGLDAQGRKVNANPLGNPFSEKADTLASEKVSSRAESISRYTEYFDSSYGKDARLTEAVDALAERILQGENITLGCWCKPLPCHGDVLAGRIVSIARQRAQERGIVLAEAEEAQPEQAPSGEERLRASADHARVSGLAGALEGFVNHSGGALGSDITWGEALEAFGGSSVHYYHGRKTPYGTSEITQAEFDEGREHVATANETLHRKGYEKYMDLLARNWHQVKNADEVFAVGTMNRDLFGSAAGTSFTVSGGTGWAVQMAVDAGKPVNFFDQEEGIWYRYTPGAGWAAQPEGHIPALTPDFAGIGTRDLTSAGARAIYAVVARAALRRAGELGTAAVSKPLPAVAPGESTVNVWAGTGENTVLSNLAKRPFTISSRYHESAKPVFQSEEHNFQWLKAVYAGDGRAADAVLAAPGGEAARAAGRTAVMQDGADIAGWDSLAVVAMEYGLPKSFEQNPAAMQALTDTRGKRITHIQAGGRWASQFPEVLTAYRSRLYESERAAKRRSAETPLVITRAEEPFTRAWAQAHPEVAILFADNTDRDSGHGVIDRDSSYYKTYGDGKADLHFPTQTSAVVRGLPNAFPLSTQRWYHEGAKGTSGRWTDADAELFRKTIHDEAVRFISHLRENPLQYERVVIPQGGFGNSQISAITKERTPVLWKILVEELRFIKEGVSEVNDLRKGFAAIEHPEDVEEMKPAAAEPALEQVAETVAEQAKPAAAEVAPASPSPEEMLSAPAPAAVERDIWAPEGRNAGLSLTAPMPFSLDDHEFPTVQHYMEWRKATLFRDEKAAGDILSSDVKTAMQIGQRIKGFDADKWNEALPYVLLASLREAYSVNPEAAERLLGTKEDILTYKNGIPPMDEVFPEVLMIIRDEMASRRREESFRLGIAEAGGENRIAFHAVDPFGGADVGRYREDWLTVATLPEQRDYITETVRRIALRGLGLNPAAWEDTDRLDIARHIFASGMTLHQCLAFKHSCAEAVAAAFDDDHMRQAALYYYDTLTYGEHLPDVVSFIGSLSARNVFDLDAGGDIRPLGKNTFAVSFPEDPDAWYVMVMRTDSKEVKSISQELREDMGRMTDSNFSTEQREEDRRFAKQVSSLIVNDRPLSYSELFDDDGHPLVRSGVLSISDDGPEGRREVVRLFVDEGTPVEGAPRTDFDLTHYGVRASSSLQGESTLRSALLLEDNPVRIKPALSRNGGWEDTPYWTVKDFDPVKAIELGLSGVGRNVARTEPSQRNLDALDRFVAGHYAGRGPEAYADVITDELEGKGFKRPVSPQEIISSYAAIFRSHVMTADLFIDIDDKVKGHFASTEEEISARLARILPNGYTSGEMAAMVRTARDLVEQETGRPLGRLYVPASWAEGGLFKTDAIRAREEEEKAREAARIKIIENREPENEYMTISGQRFFGEGRRSLPRNDGHTVLVFEADERGARGRGVASYAVKAFGAGEGVVNSLSGDSFPVFTVDRKAASRLGLAFRPSASEEEAYNRWLLQPLGPDRGENPLVWHGENGGTLSAENWFVNAERLNAYYESHGGDYSLVLSDYPDMGERSVDPETLIASYTEILKAAVADPRRTWCLAFDGRDDVPGRDGYLLGEKAYLLREAQRRAGLYPENLAFPRSMMEYIVPEKVQAAQVRGEEFFLSGSDDITEKVRRERAESSLVENLGKLEDGSRRMTGNFGPAVISVSDPESGADLQAEMRISAVMLTDGTSPDEKPGLAVEVTDPDSGEVFTVPSADLALADLEAVCDIVRVSFGLPAEGRDASTVIRRLPNGCRLEYDAFGQGVLIDSEGNRVFDSTVDVMSIRPTTETIPSRNRRDGATLVIHNVIRGEVINPDGSRQAFVFNTRKPGSGRILGYSGEEVPGKEAFLPESAQRTVSMQDIFRIRQTDSQFAESIFDISDGQKAPDALVSLSLDFGNVRDWTIASFFSKKGGEPGDGYVPVELDPARMESATYISEVAGQIVEGLESTAAVRTAMESGRNVDLMLSGSLAAEINPEILPHEKLDAFVAALVPAVRERMHERGMTLGSIASSARKGVPLAALRSALGAGIPALAVTDAGLSREMVFDRMEKEVQDAVERYAEDRSAFPTHWYTRSVDKLLDAASPDEDEDRLQEDTMEAEDESEAQELFVGEDGTLSYVASPAESSAETAGEEEKPVNDDVKSTFTFVPRAAVWSAVVGERTRISEQVAGWETRMEELKKEIENSPDEVGLQEEYSELRRRIASAKHHQEDLSDLYDRIDAGISPEEKASAPAFPEGVDFHNVIDIQKAFNNPFKNAFDAEYRFKPGTEILVGGKPVDLSGMTFSAVIEYVLRGSPLGSPALEWYPAAGLSGDEFERRVMRPLVRLWWRQNPGAVAKMRKELKDISHDLIITDSVLGNESPFKSLMFLNGSDGYSDDEVFTERYLSAEKMTRVDWEKDTVYLFSYAGGDTYDAASDKIRPTAPVSLDTLSALIPEGVQTLYQVAMNPTQFEFKKDSRGWYVHQDAMKNVFAAQAGAKFINAPALQCEHLFKGGAPKATFSKAMESLEKSVKEKGEHVAIGVQNDFYATRYLAQELERRGLHVKWLRQNRQGTVEAVSQWDKLEHVLRRQITAGRSSDITFTPVKRGRAQYLLKPGTELSVPAKKADGVSIYDSMVQTPDREPNYGGKTQIQALSGARGMTNVDARLIGNSSVVINLGGDRARNLVRSLNNAQAVSVDRLTAEDDVEGEDRGSKMQVVGNVVNVFGIDGSLSRQAGRLSDPDYARRQAVEALRGVYQIEVRDRLRNASTGGGRIDLSHLDVSFLLPNSAELSTDRRTVKVSDEELAGTEGIVTEARRPSEEVDDTAIRDAVTFKAADADGVNDQLRTEYTGEMLDDTGADVAVDGESPLRTFCRNFMGYLMDPDVQNEAYMRSNPGSRNSYISGAGREFAEEGVLAGSDHEINITHVSTDGDNGGPIEMNNAASYFNIDNTAFATVDFAQTFPVAGIGSGAVFQAGRPFLQTGRQNPPEVPLAVAERVWRARFNEGLRRPVTERELIDMATRRKEREYDTQRDGLVPGLTDRQILALDAVGGLSGNDITGILMLARSGVETISNGEDLAMLVQRYLGNGVDPVYRDQIREIDEKLVPLSQENKDNQAFVNWLRLFHYDFALATEEAHAHFHDHPVNPNDLPDRYADFVRERIMKSEHHHADYPAGREYIDRQIESLKATVLDGTKKGRTPGEWQPVFEQDFTLAAHQAVNRFAASGEDPKAVAARCAEAVREALSSKDAAYPAWIKERIGWVVSDFHAEVESALTEGRDIVVNSPRESVARRIGSRDVRKSPLYKSTAGRLAASEREVKVLSERREAILHDHFLYDKDHLDAALEDADRIMEEAAAAGEQLLTPNSADYPDNCRAMLNEVFPEVNLSSPLSIITGSDGTVSVGADYAETLSQVRTQRRQELARTLPLTRDDGWSAELSSLVEESISSIGEDDADRVLRATLLRTALVYGYIAASTGDAASETSARVAYSRTVEAHPDKEWLAAWDTRVRSLIDKAAGSESRKLYADVFKAAFYVVNAEAQISPQEVAFHLSSTNERVPSILWARGDVSRLNRDSAQTVALLGRRGDLSPEDSARLGRKLADEGLSWSAYMEDPSFVEERTPVQGRRGSAASGDATAPVRNTAAAALEAGQSGVAVVGDISDVKKDSLADKNVRAGGTTISRNRSGKNKGQRVSGDDADVKQETAVSAALSKTALFLGDGGHIDPNDPLSVALAYMRVLVGVGAVLPLTLVNEKKKEKKVKEQKSEGDVKKKAPTADSPKEVALEDLDSARREFLKARGLDSDETDKALSELTKPETSKTGELSDNPVSGRFRYIRSAEDGTVHVFLPESWTTIRQLVSEQVGPKVQYHKPEQYDAVLRDMSLGTRTYVTPSGTRLSASLVSGALASVGAGLRPETGPMFAGKGRVDTLRSLVDTRNPLKMPGLGSMAKREKDMRSFDSLCDNLEEVISLQRRLEGTSKVVGIDGLWLDMDRANMRVSIMDGKTELAAVYIDDAGYFRTEEHPRRTREEERPEDEKGRKDLENDFTKQRLLIVDEEDILNPHSRFGKIDSTEKVRRLTGDIRKAILNQYRYDETKQKVAKSALKSLNDGSSVQGLSRDAEGFTEEVSREQAWLMADEVVSSLTKEIDDAGEQIKQIVNKPVKAESDESEIKKLKTKVSSLYKRNDIAREIRDRVLTARSLTVSKDSDGLCIDDVVLTSAVKKDFSPAQLEEGARTVNRLIRERKQIASRIIESDGVRYLSKEHGGAGVDESILTAAGYRAEAESRLNSLRYSVEVMQSDLEALASSPTLSRGSKVAYVASEAAALAQAMRWNWKGTKNELEGFDSKDFFAPTRSAAEREALLKSALEAAVEFGGVTEERAQTLKLRIEMLMTNDAILEKNREIRDLEAVLSGDTSGMSPELIAGYKASLADKRQYLAFAKTRRSAIIEKAQAAIESARQSLAEAEARVGSLKGDELHIREDRMMAVEDISVFTSGFNVPVEREDAWLMVSRTADAMSRRVDEMTDSINRLMSDEMTLREAAEQAETLESEQMLVRAGAIDRDVAALTRQRDALLRRYFVMEEMLDKISVASLLTESEYGADGICVDDVVVLVPHEEFSEEQKKQATKELSERQAAVQQRRADAERDLFPRRFVDTPGQIEKIESRIAADTEKRDQLEGKLLATKTYMEKKVEEAKVDGKIADEIPGLRDAVRDMELMRIQISDLNHSIAGLKNDRNRLEEEMKHLHTEVVLSAAKLGFRKVRPEMIPAKVPTTRGVIANVPSEAGLRVFEHTDDKGRKWYGYCTSSGEVASDLYSVAYPMAGRCYGVVKDTDGRVNFIGQDGQPFFDSWFDKAYNSAGSKRFMVVQLGDRYNVVDLVSGGFMLNKEWSDGISPIRGELFIMMARPGVDDVKDANAFRKDENGNMVPRMHIIDALTGVPVSAWYDSIQWKQVPEEERLQAKKDGKPLPVVAEAFLMQPDGRKSTMTTMTMKERKADGAFDGFTLVTETVTKKVSFELTLHP